MKPFNLSRSFDCVIVGGGHGGSQTAAALRQSGFTGSIALIGAEPEVPYDRPSLSKDYLAGKKSFDRMYLRPQDFWAAREVELLLGRHVSAVNPEARTVTTDRGECFTYGQLVWAAGGDPRKLTCPGKELTGVFYIRSKADCDALIDVLPDAQRIVIIGGGYIGLEAAAVFREIGKDVILVEALDRVLARVAGEPVSRFYENEHQAHGVDIRLNSSVASLDGTNGRVSSVVLVSGEAVAADIVVVGIGIIPSVGPLAAAGAEGANGIDVDAFCRTSLPDIYCIGDCARLQNGPGIRIESVQNATDQATTAAKAICGEFKAYDATPWFWSDQYDLKIQTVGLNCGFDSIVTRGDPATRSFSVIYLKNGAVLALDCINSPRDYVQGRKLVDNAARIDPAALADTSRQLKEIDLVMS
ncbi:pyridine nucleotide-disulfide oxidoreductase [Rhizobium leguminosarum bv. trifolii]|uniref:NAD(P)/FAD-dependent oxidoreductase n=1 Tax=Rhizobium leguminosarum TaxID=384 RepID=UPI000E2F7F32|nr:FAD-dependent oxidoreductase [Rhizobium leguminosarum]RFB88811.1 pyridine nucleotide-disulfide oxidoreductase [Rhizobium leguminosarum bv. trifolii]